MSDAREQAIDVLTTAYLNIRPGSRHIPDLVSELLDALLAASQDDGSPLALLAPEQVVECTGVSATWCPVHGDCTCSREGALDMPSCPLHGTTSEHGGNPND